MKLTLRGREGCGRLRAGAYKRALRWRLRWFIRGLAPLQCSAALRLAPTYEPLAPPGLGSGELAGCGGSDSAGPEA